MDLPPTQEQMDAAKDAAPGVPLSISALERDMADRVLGPPPPHDYKFNLSPVGLRASEANLRASITAEELRMRKSKQREALVDYLRDDTPARCGPPRRVLVWIRERANAPRDVFAEALGISEGDLAAVEQGRARLAVEWPVKK